MTSVCCYFQVHQPLRHRHFTFFDIGQGLTYEDEDMNRQILNRVAEKCYLPANRLMLELIKKFGGEFRIAFSLTGIVLEQMEKYRPDALDSFKRLSDTGCVEFLSETYYHSLASLYSPREFREQVEQHRVRVRELFGQDPVTFRNTELVYSNDLAGTVEKMGFRVVLADAADTVLDGRSPNRIYQPPGCRKIRLLLKNHRLSDDIAFRFSSRQWPEYPLTAGKYAKWIHQITDGHVINLFMDYETFGEHQWKETGIFEFLKAFPREVLKHPGFRFKTPAEAAHERGPAVPLDIPNHVSWADTERDLTAWIGNPMQADAFGFLYSLEKKVKRKKDAGVLKMWRRLQISDHFYYMCTKRSDDGDVHRYFNPHPSPYDAYINYMNVMADFDQTLKEKGRSHGSR
jgi:alpha-amylase